MIRRKEIYVDENDRTLAALTELPLRKDELDTYHNTPEPHLKTTYHGSGQLKFANGATEGTANFNYEIPAAGVAEAFEKMQEAHDAATARTKEEVNKFLRKKDSQIIIAGSAADAAPKLPPNIRLAG